ncbi:MAG TPA: hypothetical protein ENG35_07375, partial [Desulfobacteraceae bacterium]|nr:hypothetical protein [Desulfobacteraceae bacterium]
WRFVSPMFEEKTAPCSAACPAGEDIGRIEMLTAQGLFKRAWEAILMENPFPSVCGRICFHPCENFCNRKEFDESIALHSLERFLGDIAIAEGLNQPLKNLPANGKKIAIAGAGPAGLSAAFFLTRLGYSCTIFEEKSEPGGILRWGIPSYRLPDDILKSEIKRILDSGVEIRCNTPVTKSFMEKEIGYYDAFFIGSGHSISIKMDVYGEDAASDGLKFLYNIRKGEITSINCTAAVIGGGNTAIDVSRSLIRLGANVILMYRRRRQDMPAFANEVEMALKEGVQLMELVSPIGLEKDGKNLLLTLQKMKIADTLSGGRPQVVPDSTKTETLRVGKIFAAVGAGPDKLWQIPCEDKDDNKILRLSHCIISIEKYPKIFAGDLTNHTKSAVDAIASGKQAAMALDILFNEGRDSIKERLSSCKVGDGPALSMEIYMNGKRKSRNSRIVYLKDINTDYFMPALRIIPLSLSPELCIKSFSQVEQTLTTDSAMKEASRCFNCGLCNNCDNCRLFCPEMAVISEDNNRRINFDYCKGCGICVVECPRSAMALKEE